jgi:hypothetical protein
VVEEFEYTKTGWPKCVDCGEDSLLSPWLDLNVEGMTRPPELFEFYEHDFWCAHCRWWGRIPRPRG